MLIYSKSRERSFLHPSQDTNTTLVRNQLNQRSLNHLQRKPHQQKKKQKNHNLHNQLHLRSTPKCHHWKTSDQKRNSDLKIRFRPSPKTFPNCAHTIFYFIKSQQHYFIYQNLTIFQNLLLRLLCIIVFSILKHFQIFSHHFSQILIHCTCFILQILQRTSKQGNSFPYVHFKFSLGPNAPKFTTRELLPLCVF